MGCRSRRTTLREIVALELIKHADVEQARLELPAAVEAAVARELERGQVLGCEQGRPVFWPVENLEERK